MSKNRGKSPKVVDNRVLKIIRSSKNNQAVMTRRVITEIPEEEILKYSKLVSKHIQIKSILLSGPRAYSSFYKIRRIGVSLSRCIRWSEAIILNNIDQINEFIEIEKSITNDIHKQDYNSALESINGFESCYGNSLSLLQLKLHCMLKLKGKDYAEEYLSSEKELVSVPLCGFFMNYQIQRIDEEATYRERTSELNIKFNEAFGKDEELLSIIKYKILPLEFCLEINLNHILSYELDSSVVDLYKAYCFSASMAVNNTYDIKKEFLKSTMFICRKVNDKSLKSISFSLGDLDLVDSIFDEDSIKYIDSYTKGDYLDVCNQYPSNVKLLESFNAFDIYVKSIARVDEKSKPNLNLIFSDNIVLANLNMITQKKTDYHIANLSYQLSSLTWYFNQHIFSCINSLSLNESNLNKFKLMYFSRSDIFSAFKCSNLTEPDARAIIEALEKYDDSSISLQLYKSISSDDGGVTKIERLNISKDRKLKYIALYLYKNNSFELAVPYFELMYLSEDRITNVESIYGLIHCLLKTGRVLEAAKLVAKSIITDGLDNVTLPFYDLCSSLKKEIRSLNSIYIPVCLHLYYKYYGEEYFSALKFGFEKYMVENNISKLESIFEVENETDISVISYFLMHVFVPNVMKGPILFSESKAIESKRIEVCQFILENKLGNKGKILEEIKDRSKTLVLNDVRSHVGTNKIYVDTEYVKDKLYDKCKVVYFKYMEQVRLCLPENEDEVGLLQLSQNLQEKFQNDEGLSGRHYYRLIRGVHIQDRILSDKSKLFSLLMRTIRDEFTSGVKGINGYLTTRIKHGVLEDHYLKALLDDIDNEDKDEGLLTLSTSAEYKYNYSQQISLEDTSVAFKIDPIINKFSSEFDKVINIVLNEWLNIKLHDLEFNLIKEVDKESIFNYCISNVTVMELQRLISPETSYDEIWDLIFNWLWVNTDQILIEIKEKFAGELQFKFKELFTSFQMEVDKVNGKHVHKYNDLVSSITKSKIKIERNVNESIGWFTRNTVLIENEVDLEVILEIVMTSLSIKAKVSITDAIKIEGNQVRYYIDILYILFSNALEYSNLKRNAVELNFYGKLERGILTFKLNNNCHQIDNIILENKKLEKYKDIYKSEKTLDKLTGVGDTGYYKLQKIIVADLSKKYKCKLEYISFDCFSTIVEIMDE